jgi:type VI secretion system secreted protein Hcp
MAIDMFLEVTDKKAGAIKGEAKGKAHADKIVVLNYSFHVEAPRDIATGLASGKRRHYPLSITKLVDRSSPLLFQALTTNSVLTKVVLTVRRGTTTEGKFDDVVYTLTNGGLTNIETGIDIGLSDDDDNDADQKRNTETLQISYQKIKVEHVIGKTEAEDEWALTS